MVYRGCVVIWVLCLGCSDGNNGTENPETDAARESADSGSIDGQVGLTDMANVVDMSEIDARRDVGARDVDAGPSAVDLGVTLPDALATPADMGALPADAGVTPADMGPQGDMPTSCGSPRQGLMPVDCTVAGDDSAQCVFSNHCLCSAGFVCSVQTMWPGTQECDPGAICVPDEPVGTTARSCGAPPPDRMPIDCTENGDVDAFCVFGDHCACSEGFVCEESGTPGECLPGQSCVPSQ